MTQNTKKDPSEPKKRTIRHIWQDIIILQIIVLSTGVIITCCFIDVPDSTLIVELFSLLIVFALGISSTGLIENISKFKSNLSSNVSNVVNNIESDK